MLREVGRIFQETVTGVGNQGTQQLAADKDMKCHQCGKVGHLKAVCRSKQKGKEPKGHPPRVLLQPVCHLEDKDEEEYIPLYHLSSKKGSPPIRAQAQVDDKFVTMEVDTGAAKSLMSEATSYGLWPGRSLDATDVRLCSYSREPIPVLGYVQVKVTYQGQVATLPLL